MPEDDDIAFTLVVDYFRPDGKWYETVSTDVTFVEVPTFNLEDDFCNLFFEKTGRLVPHPKFTSNQHPKDQNFCRYLIQPETIISLEGLTKYYDATIYVAYGVITVETDNEGLLQDIKNLPLNCGYKYKEGQHQLYPLQYNSLQLAERIAIDWESKGYSVRRQHTSVATKNHVEEVHSFLF